MSAPVSANVVDASPHGWRASQRGDLDRVVRSAGRHSRFVRVLRIALPAGVVLVVAGYVFVNYFLPMTVLDALPKVSGKLAVQGSKITMELPRIAGFTRDSRAYELNAETAVQDISKPDVVELQNLRAKMEMHDKDVVQLSAKTGVYNTKGDQMVLRDQVFVTSKQGYEAKLSEAAVDMKKGNVVSDKPIEVKLPNGLLNANGLEIDNSGEVIRFTRGVVLNLDGKKPTEEATR